MSRIPGTLVIQLQVFLIKSDVDRYVIVASILRVQTTHRNELQNHNRILNVQYDDDFSYLIIANNTTGGCHSCQQTKKRTISTVVRETWA